MALHLADLTADDASAEAVRATIERFAATVVGRLGPSTAQPAAATPGAAGGGSVGGGSAGGAQAASGGEGGGVAGSLLESHMAKELESAAVEARQAAAAASAAEGLTVSLRHRYAPPVRVALQLRSVGIGAESLLCATLVRSGLSPWLVLVDGRGKIGFISADLAAALGGSAEGLLHQSVADLMPQVCRCGMSSIQSRTPRCCCSFITTRERVL